MLHRSASFPLSLSIEIHENNKSIFCVFSLSINTAGYLHCNCCCCFVAVAIIVVISIVVVIVVFALWLAACETFYLNAFQFVAGLKLLCVCARVRVCVGLCAGVGVFN